MRTTAAAALIALSFPACADIELQSEGISGMVRSSGSPVRNAYVVARWVVNMSTGHAGPYCDALTVVAADGQGNYQMGPWRKAIEEKGGFGGTELDSLSVQLYAYAPGYELAKNGSAGISGKRGYAKLPKTVVDLEMIPARTDERPRVQYLDSLFTHIACPGRSPGGRPLYEALMREARNYPSAADKGMFGMSFLDKLESFSRSADSSEKTNTEDSRK